MFSESLLHLNALGVPVTFNPLIRLKRSSFLLESKRLERRNQELLDHTPQPIPATASKPAWERESFPVIRDSIPRIQKRGTQSDLERKVLTLEYIQSSYPEEQWTHVYTDGSATEATRNGGGGVFIKYNDEDSSFAVPTGKYSTNYKAEAEALKTAAQELSTNQQKVKQNVVIFSDALSVLQSLQKPGKDLNELCSALTDLSNCKEEIVLQWIPAHCGISGNEKADHLAKEGGLQEQEDTRVGYSDEKTIIKALVNKKWRQEHPKFDKMDGYHKMNRTDQVIMLRLRTGHNRMRAHLFNKLKIGESDLCPCDTAPMTTAHLLQDCPLHDALRQATWPTVTTLTEKLYGDLASLRRTAAFVRETGVTI